MPRRNVRLKHKKHCLVKKWNFIEKGGKHEALKRAYFDKLAELYAAFKDEKSFDELRQLAKN
ncbi:hypothetical protein B9G39_29890 [Zooshikella ganghwensis]|uniref:Uncharacterized protein n=1 Tax=Zooshikella ganghwensis TaxID=202772 RepID=A0A4P9VG13_9GAMM|nr:hypothetical protein B9G39_29890 [Zooshikella ganghwensis]